MTARVRDAATGQRYVCRLVPCRGQEEVDFVLKEAYRIQVQCEGVGMTQKTLWSYPAFKRRRKRMIFAMAHGSLKIQRPIARWFGPNGPGIPLFTTGLLLSFSTAFG